MSTILSLLLTITISTSLPANIEDQFLNSKTLVSSTQKDSQFSDKNPSIQSKTKIKRAKMVSQVDKLKTKRVVGSQNTMIDYFASKGIILRGVRSFGSDEEVEASEMNSCGSQVQAALEKLNLPAENLLKNLYLTFNQRDRRGLGGGDTIVLRCVNVDDDELISVLIHELGHIADASLLVGTEQAGESLFLDGNKTVRNDDPSLNFYRISWQDSFNLKSSSSPEDFVTGYAMTDPFEDFAETYNFYFLHGNKFREMAKSNAKLQAKYDFMKNFVFNQQEFKRDLLVNAEVESLRNGFRNYDSTVLEYSL